MDIISCFVREQKRYKKSELQSLFSYTEDEVEVFIKNLKAYNVLKVVKNNKEQVDMSDLIDEGIEVTNENRTISNYLYVFTYVGVIVVGRRIVKVYPKYKKSKEISLDEMKQVLMVLDKYNNSQEQIINMYNGDEDNISFNILPVILYLLNDYYQYGVYNESQDIVEINGEGPVLWEKTINNCLPIIYKNRPYYMELYTRKTIDDDENYFKKLHEWILTDCSNQLRNSNLEELFDIVPVELSQEKLEYFGDIDYILNRLNSELSIQFNTRKQILLKTMYTYIEHNKRLFEDEQSISMYGSTAFNMVWEKVCANVFDNKLNMTLGCDKFGLSQNISEKYNKNLRLIDIIDKPIWYGDNTIKKSKDTLTPDVITIGQCVQGDYFIILDAKYYNIELEKNKPLKGNPGIEDVSKQYLYQLAYKDFIKEHNIKIVKNCFIMPNEFNKVVNKGKVELPMLKDLGLNDIEIWMIPTEMMFRHYLAGTHINFLDII